MSYTAEEQAILSRVATEWGATTEIAWPNVDFNPADEVSDGDSWIRISIQRGPGTATQADIGSTAHRYRHRGTLVCQIFAPQGKGTGPVMALADQFAASFRSVTDTGVTYLTPSVGTVGSDGPWHQVNVTVDYYRDEVI